MVGIPALMLGIGLILSAGISRIIARRHGLISEKTDGGVHKFMLCAAMAPLLLIFVPCYLTIWDPVLVFYHAAYVSILSLILIELLLFRFTKLSFTCSYLPGKANIILLWPVYLFACYVYSYGMTTLEVWLTENRPKAIFHYIGTASVAQVSAKDFSFEICISRI